MNTVAIAPEVQDFLAAVRAHLTDLDPEEQREILDGLEADLGELVAERGPDALGDPTAYAAELRTAAGLEPLGRTKPAKQSTGDRVHAVLDGARGTVDQVVLALPGDLGPLLSWLRPLWWVARGWLAVQVLDLFLGRGRYAGDLGLVPNLQGLGWIVLGVAVFGSIQLGRRKIGWWPARPTAAARVVLLAFNTFAVVMTPIVLLQVEQSSNAEFSRGFEVGYQNAARDTREVPKAGLYLDGIWISNIYPYDAQGRPLAGVQLFNQAGQPISVTTQPEYVEPEIDANGNEIDADGNLIDPTTAQLPRIYYPWTNGVTQLFNVFPLPSRLQESEELSATAFTEKDRPQIGKLPLASVPPVSLPGIPTKAP